MSLKLPRTKNAKELLNEAKIIEIHEDNKPEKNENVFSVAILVSFLRVDDEVVPIKIVVKSYGKEAYIPYKIYVFSARRESKRDLVLQHRHPANAAILPKSLLSINILDFFKLSRDPDLLIYSQEGQWTLEKRSTSDRKEADCKRVLLL